tara:strand:+ start:342 stop:1367 length:1026 start_codon:yes stop_codon:yes gene_type:complete
MASKRKVYGIPLIGYLLHLVEAFFKLPRNDNRLASLRREYAQLSFRVDQVEQADIKARHFYQAWDQQLPQFLNAVSTVSAFGHQLQITNSKIESLEELHNEISERPVEDDEASEFAPEDLKLLVQHQAQQAEQIGKIWDRVEFVRREIMYEMLYGAKAVQKTGEGRVVAVDKLEAARLNGDVKLNLGCGHIAMDGYINVDMRELPTVDIISRVDNIPIEPGSVSEIFSSHLVEHFPQEELRRLLLPYWFNLLKPGGMFRAITPDATAMIAAAATGGYGFEDFREVLFGAQDYHGDFHYNLLSPLSMTELLKEAGFSEIHVPVEGRRNGKCYEFEIMAIKPV